MRDRIERLFDVAHAYGYTDLVLGAWGCGAFGNDPQKIANISHREQYVLYLVVTEESVLSKSCNDP